MLGAQEDFEVVGEAEDGAQAVEEALRLRPDVVVMDIRMPKLDWSAPRVASSSTPRPQVLVLTTFDLDEYVYEALRAGCERLHAQGRPAGRAAEAVRTVAVGDSLLAPAVTRRLVERYVRLPPDAAARETFGELTERELEVLKLVAGGLSNAEIAERLFLSEATVKTHLTRISKLGLRDRVQAVVLAYESGLVEPGASADGDPADSAE